MKICIVGTGYVGLVSAACFAELGHEVIGVDIDHAKVTMLKSGKSPIYEPGLEELIVSGLKSGRLQFTTSLVEALSGTKIVFSAVATPTGDGAKADLKAVFAVAESVARLTKNDIVFVNKSTVPVGTGKLCEQRIQKILKARNVQYNVPVVSNPEFLREGMAVPDTMMPDRIVIGMNGTTRNKKPAVRGPDGPSGPERETRNLMEEIYRPITRVGKPLIFMSRESAEIVKYASNAFLATKISFINMFTELAEVTGANIRDIATSMGLDPRIGPKFLHAGIGYGGSCFPKDVKALIATGKELGIPMPIVEATDNVNVHQRERCIQRILKALPKKSHVAVWGLSFKPKTDDMREAPSIDVIHALIKAGHTVRAFDPVTMEKAKPLLPRKIVYAKSPIDAAKNADAVVLLTEWDVFRGIDLEELKAVMKGNLLFDGRNVYELKKARAAGFVYHCLGIQM